MLIKEQEPLAKQVVDTLDDRELSRDRIILQRIIDRGYTSDGYFYFYLHGSWINYHEYRFDVLSLVICENLLLKWKYNILGMFAIFTTDSM